MESGIYTRALHKGLATDPSIVNFAIFVDNIMNIGFMQSFFFYDLIHIHCQFSQVFVKVEEIFKIKYSHVHFMAILALPTDQNP